MTGGLSLWHWAIIAVVVVILFGSKKLPEAARGLGRSLRIFKSEIKEMQNEGTATAPPTPTTELPAPPPAADPAPPQVNPTTHTEPKSA